MRKYKVIWFDDEHENFQTYKDEAMSNDSDFSFVIWDGKSKGSFANILRAIDSNKFAKVYYINNYSIL